MIIKPILTGLLTIGVLMSVQETKAIAQPAPQVLLAGNPKASSDWIRFTSRKHGFTALMPGNSKISDRLGAVKKDWTIAGTDSDTSYSISYLEDDETTKLTDANMNKLVNHLFKQGQFEEVKRFRFTIRGYPGRESSFRGPGVTGYLRIYAVRTRLYMTIVVTRGGNERKIADFLDSFGLF